MITLTAEQHVLPGKEAQVDTLMARLMADISRHEPGCTRFDYVVDDADTSRRLVVETYRDEVAFAQHGASSYLAEFSPQLVACLVEPPTVVRFSADKCGQILYHAYWEPDMAARWEWLKTEGPGVEAAFRMDEHSAPFSMITARDPFGNRIEYVGVEAADPLTEWARTGVLPSGVGA